MPKEKKESSDSTVVADTFEEELKSIKEKGAALKGEQREFYGQIVQRLENNVQVLNDLRTEHSTLRKQLKEQSEKQNKLSSNVDLNNDIKRTRNRVNVIKMQIDRINFQKQESIDRQKELRILLEKFKSGEGQESEDQQKIAAFKHKLSNARIKNEEALSVEKLYDKIITLFEKQKMHWKPELEKTLQRNEQKQKDVAGLVLVARDSKFSKNTAKNEYGQAEKSATVAKKKRDSELEKKKKLIQEKAQPHSADLETKDYDSKQDLTSQTSVMRNRLPNRLNREKKEEKFKNVSSTLEEIREYFGTIDPEKIKDFFEERRNTSRTLKSQIEELDIACDTLEKQRNRTKSALEEAEYTSSKGIGGNRVISEGRNLLSQRKQELMVSQAKTHATEKLHRDVIIGIEHLLDVVALLKKEEIDSDPLKILEWTKAKSELLKKETPDDDTDYLDICNPTVLAELVVKANASDFDIQKVDSSKRVVKKQTEGLKRPQKEQKTDIQTRVLSRAQAKKEALRIFQQTSEKKPAGNP